MKHVIHIYGASGSGTSTLAKRLSEELGYTFMDTDDYYWLSTDPKFTVKRDVQDRVKRMQEDLNSAENVVLSGSLAGWGDELISEFTLAVRMVTDTELRLERIRKREYERFGERIMPGGDMYEQHQAFLHWAATYDDGGANMRSKAKHDLWQTKLQCRHIVLNGADSMEQKVLRVKQELMKQG
jgi:uridine kinase